MQTQKVPAVQMRDISKYFGSVAANLHVDLTVNTGEILSLLGENGSGKTTLMNMLSGIYFPDEGEIFVKGEKVIIRSPKDAFSHGIGMIHQHFKLIDIFTAAENITLGLKDTGAYDLKEVCKQVTAICEKYEFDLDPNQKVYDMSVSQKQTLEIIKVLYRGADVLILDEPTAVLTPQETEKLFAVIRNMRNDGKSIIIITHKLHEVLAISDRVSVLRKGEYVGSVNTADATALSLTEMMVGKKVTLDIARPEPKDRQLRIAVNNLTVTNIDQRKVLDNVSFEAYSGEILGIAGISGCGQRELLESIAGLQPTQPGSSITYTAAGKEPVELIGKTPRKIRDYGIALSFVPEDRLGMGLVGGMGMTENMMLKTYGEGAPIFKHTKQPRELAERIKEQLEVYTPSVNTPVRQLSGGNVQKVLVGREISSAPSVLMTAYAVRGLDINTSYAIYDLLNVQKKAGVAVIYVGEDLDVLLELSDRIMVLCGGKVSGIVDGRTATKEQVGMLMTHLNETEGEQ